MPRPPEDFEIDWNKTSEPEPQVPAPTLTPAPCDPEMFRFGDLICAIQGPRAFTIEEWIVKVREKSGQRVDWYFSGGVAQVLFIGDHEKVAAAIRELESELIAAYMACGRNGYVVLKPEPSDVRFQWCYL